MKTLRPPTKAVAKHGNALRESAMDRRAKLRAQRAASRNTQFSIWMQALAQDLERLKQTIDAQLEAATDDAVEDSAG